MCPYKIMFRKGTNRKLGSFPLVFSNFPLGKYFFPAKNNQTQNEIKNLFSKPIQISICIHY